MQKFCIGDPQNLYSFGSHLGLALGVTQILCFRVVASKPMHGPNTNGFVLQWNIGFSFHLCQKTGNFLDFLHFIK